MWNGKFYACDGNRQSRLILFLLTNLLYKNHTPSTYIFHQILNMSEHRYLYSDHNYYLLHTHMKLLIVRQTAR